MSITVTAKTLDLALIRAAGQLGISSDQVGHEVKVQSGGFLGMGKKVTIEAWNKADRKTSSKDRGAQRSQKNSKRNKRYDKNRTQHHDNSEKIELPESQVAELKQELTGFLTEIVELAVGEPTEVESKDEGGRLVLNIKSDYLAKQFTKNSKLAESFEHLLRKKPRHLRQELPFRVFVDANNVRVSREVELSELAKELSDKVHTQNKPVVLNYKSSYDRKVIHMALDKDDRVYTKSIGKGPNRKLMILPTTDGDGESNLEMLGSSIQADDHQPIAALSSARGSSGVAVVRLSGKDTHKLIFPLLKFKFLKDPSKMSFAKLYLCELVDCMTDKLSHEVIDEPLVVFFKGPSSYTGEDSAELHLHGGPYIVERTLRLLYGVGFRPAEAGEFTRRAFLNGKMDLTTAEGIKELASASSQTTVGCGKSTCYGNPC